MSRSKLRRLAFGVTAIIIAGIVSLEDLSAKEISTGATSHRSSARRTVAPRAQPANPAPQPGNEMQNWCPTCSWRDQYKGSY
jgi:hypothetical protein